MNFKINELEIRKKARFLSAGNEQASRLLIVMHGYAQLAEYFLRNFEFLAQNNYLVVAPEGTHRFYINGTSGRVGASWMTKDWREQDIADNMLYLESLLETLAENRTFEQISLLGFSQGGATAARWLFHSKFKFHHFILWACVFPDDMSKNLDSLKHKASHSHFVLGTEDEYFTDNNQAALQRFQKLGFLTNSFEGTHRIHEDTLKSILVD